MFFLDQQQSKAAALHVTRTGPASVALSRPWIAIPAANSPWRSMRRSGLSLFVVVLLHTLIVLALLNHRPSAITPPTFVQPMMVALITTATPQPAIAPPLPIETPPKVEPQERLAKPPPKKVVEKKTVTSKPRAIQSEEQPAPAPTAAAPAAPKEATPAPMPLEPPRFDAAHLHNPKPAYPAISRRTGEQGRVMLKVLVSPDGSPEVVEIKTSSGHERLDSAAIKIVKTAWRFVPARRGDQPIRDWVIVPINFSLKG